MSLIKEFSFAFNPGSDMPFAKEPYVSYYPNLSRTKKGDFLTIPGQQSFVLLTYNIQRTLEDTLLFLKFESKKDFGGLDPFVAADIANGRLLRFNFIQAKQLNLMPLLFWSALDNVFKQNLKYKTSLFLNPPDTILKVSDVFEIKSLYRARVIAYDFQKDRFLCQIIDTAFAEIKYINREEVKKKIYSGDLVIQKE